MNNRLIKISQQQLGGLKCCTLSIGVAFFYLIYSNLLQSITQTVIIFLCEF